MTLMLFEMCVSYDLCVLILFLTRIIYLLAQSYMKFALSVWEAS